MTRIASFQMTAHTFPRYNRKIMKARRASGYLTHNFYAHTEKGLSRENFFLIFFSCFF